MRSVLINLGGCLPSGDQLSQFTCLLPFLGFALNSFEAKIKLEINMKTVIKYIVSTLGYLRVWKRCGKHVNQMVDCKTFTN